MPKRARTSSTAWSSTAPAPSSGSVSWTASSSSRLVTATPTSVTPASSMSGVASASSRRTTASTIAVSAVACGRVCDRVARDESSKRRRSATVRPTRSAARSRRVTRSTRPTSAASTSSERLRPPSDAPAGRRPTAVAGRPRRGAGRGCGPGRGGGARRPARASPPAPAPAARRPRPTRVMPRWCSLAAVFAPTPHRRSTGSGWRKATSACGGTTSSPSGLATRAGHLGEELGAGHADGDRQPDALAHLLAQPRGDLRRRAGDPAQPADVEEGLVDGEPLDDRRGVVEDGEHVLAGLGVGGEARRHDDGVRAPPLGLTGRPSPCARPRPWPRSWPPARRRRRR